MNKTEEKGICEICGNKIYRRNYTKIKSKLCANCKSRNIWKEKYEELKNEYDKHKILCDIILKDFLNKLSKYEPVSEEIER